MTDFHAKYPVASQLLDFIDASPSPFHCVATVEKQLETQGFVELNEHESWPKPLPECFYVKRNESSIAAFMVPEGAHVSHGFLLAGAHTDSPCLRLKNKGEYSAHGYRQLGVEMYGGALQHTWVDRDLSVSGRLVVQQEEGERSTLLVSHETPLIRIPNLAIHLNPEANKKIKFNPQSELTPIVGIGEEECLLTVLSNQVGVDVQDILAVELFAHVTEPSQFWGSQGEFIAAPRLDNQAMCYSILQGFLEGMENDPGKIQGISFFDNEEIGSQTLQGANSNFLESLLERISSSFDASRDEYLTSLANSFFISADMAHALHPNYASSHDPNHFPEINKGPVIKSNANFRYATDARTLVAFQDLCDSVNVPCQNFINRSDLGCGSTIGPMTSARLGIRSIDVGTPQFAMHSARESAGSLDPDYMNTVFSQYFGFGVTMI